jgi:hypothetical protein
LLRAPSANQTRARPTAGRTTSSCENLERGRRRTTKPSLCRRTDARRCGRSCDGAGTDAVGGALPASSAVSPSCVAAAAAAVAWLACSWRRSAVMAAGGRPARLGIFSKSSRRGGVKPSGSRSWFHTRFLPGVMYGYGGTGPTGVGSAGGGGGGAGVADAAAAADGASPSASPSAPAAAERRPRPRWRRRGVGVADGAAASTSTTASSATGARTPARRMDARVRAGAVSSFSLISGRFLGDEASPDRVDRDRRREGASSSTTAFFRGIFYRFQQGGNPISHENGVTLNQRTLKIHSRKNENPKNGSFTFAAYSSKIPYMYTYVRRISQNPNLMIATQPKIEQNYRNK